MKRKITVHKLNSEGQEIWSYQGWELERTDVSLTLEANFDREDQALPGMTLRRGDRFVERFYSDRWYNIFRIFDVASGEFKGWYCNVSRPARLEEFDIYAEDLALDLLVMSDRCWIVLDEEEFDGLSLPHSDRKRAVAALEDLKALAETGAEFFAGP